MLYYIKLTDFSLVPHWFSHHSRLPGPSRVPAAGSSTKVQGASNLNRRSQSFNSIDKNKPPQYANGNEKGKGLKLLNLLSITYKKEKKKQTCHKGQKENVVFRLGKEYLWELGPELVFQLGYKFRCYNHILSIFDENITGWLLKCKS